ncbi:MAG: polysaccharide deacetylase family protein [Thermoflexales bacterium]|nr:polysaccharide deacetylase family protein [Thermoflexales bacterium]
MKSGHWVLGGIATLVFVGAFLASGWSPAAPPSVPIALPTLTAEAVDATVAVVATQVAAAPPPIESLGNEAMAGDQAPDAPSTDAPTATSATPAETPTPTPTATEPRPTPRFTPLFDPDATRASAATAIAGGGEGTPQPTALPSTAEVRPTVAATLRPAATPADVTAAARSLRVPILMYHYISVPPPDADRIRIDLSVTPANFEQQLVWLKQNGYTTISLTDLYNALANGAALPPRPIILTFDDGYRDAYDNAFPLLRKYGMVGTFFLITDFISANHPAYMTWPMAQAMSDAGMSMESHTRSHPDMRRRADDFLIWQLLGAIESIQAYTGKRPQFLCYPGGFFDDNTIRVARSANILAAVTTQYGQMHALGDAMTWSRVRVRGEGTLAEFASALK